MSYPDAVWERAMTVQQVILKALAARCIGTERRTFSGSRRAHSGAGGSGMRSTGILAGLWKLPVPWTPRTRPPHLGKRHKRVFHSYHRPLPNNRSNHLSNESGQITCQQHDRPGRSARPRGAPASAARCVLFIAVASGTHDVLLIVAGFMTGICATDAGASLLQRAPVPDALLASPEQY